MRQFGTRLAPKSTWKMQVDVREAYARAMGRNPRIQFAGALYHVTTRGNAKQRVCMDDWDFAWLVAQIGEVVTRYSWVCQSYCLLGNHFHVSVATPEPNLAKGMRILNGSYAQRFNRRYGRVGHVFQGRYGAELIRRHEHLLEIGRYIALNPVRAGLCSRPELWPWSSYRATIGLDEPPPWLAIDDLLAPFSGGPTPAAVRYRAFVEDGLHALRAGSRSAGSGDLVPGRGRGPGPQTGPRTGSAGSATSG
jgi:REP-associated tyrosine transposase